MNSGKMDKSEKAFDDSESPKPEIDKVVVESDCETHQAQSLSSPGKDRESVALYLQQAQELALENRFEESITAYRQALSLDPQVQALVTYQKLLTNYQDRAEPHFYLAQAFFANRDWESAIKYYRQAVAIDPDFRETYYYFGEALIKAEQWVEAASVLMVAIELDPDYAWSHHHLGMAQFHLQNWHLAEISLQSAVKLNPNFSWSYFHLAEALIKQGLLARAEQVYQQFVELEPDFAYGYQRLGDIIAQQIDISRPQDSTKVEAALRAYQRAVKLEPDNLETYYKALQLQPKDESWCLKLAQAYVRGNLLVNAIIFYQILLQIAPDRAQAHFELARVLERQDNLASAVKHYYHAANLQPTEEYLTAFKTANIALAKLEHDNGT